MPSVAFLTPNAAKVCKPVRQGDSWVWNHVCTSWGQTNAPSALANYALQLLELTGETEEPTPASLGVQASLV